MAQPLRVAQSQDEVQWLRDRAFSHLYEAEPVAWWGWKYVLGGVMIALAGFAYVQWASLRTGIASPGRVVIPRVAATAPRTPLGKNPSAAVQRSEAIPSAARSSDPGPTASSSTVSGSSALDSSASGPSAPGPSAPKASAAERADTGNTVGSPEARNARDQETLTAGTPPATEKSAKSWSPRAMPAPNAVESADSGLNSGMNGGTNELRLAQRYLGGSMGARDSAEAAKLLWKAVRQQNATAALMLSDLYAHGDGVPKSCDQARLLLLAAAKRGAPQAAQQLRSLQSRGCR